MTVVAVTGGRDFNDQVFVYKILDKIHERSPISLLIDGGARGVDTICNKWAFENNINTLRIFAEWDTFKKKAGPIRNGWILDQNPDYVIAFPGGRGTQNMKDQTNQRGIPIYEAKYSRKAYDESMEVVEKTI